MKADLNSGAETREGVGAEERRKELGITLSTAPESFGTYVEAVQTGNLLLLSGMLPTDGHSAKFIGRVGAELDVLTARAAARLAAINVLAVARQHLGSLDRVQQVVRLGFPWRPWEMFGISRTSLMERPSCYRACSERKRILVAWFMESRACRSAHRSDWKSFSKFLHKKALFT